MKFTIEEVEFEDILPHWRELWPNRTSPIEPASSMLYLGGYEILNKFWYKPRFYAAKKDGMIIGVNSGHQTGQDIYRSRGIWTHADYRLQGVGRALQEITEEGAREAGCKRLWGIPRRSSLAFFEKCGFVKMTDFFEEGVEYGPNVYCLKDIS